MFVGQYSHNIDSKGRLAVPAKFRAELKKAVVTKGLDNCLVLYSRKEWDKLAEKLAAMSIGKSKNRAFTRFMLAGAMDVEVDKQGRVILPVYLREFAALRKNVIIAGLYNRLEVWDEVRWNKFRLEAEKHSADISETLEGLGV